VFFIDLEGHIDQENVAAALEEIRPMVKELRVLGSYPIAVFNSFILWIDGHLSISKSSY
jgi:prephenate dehydratase